MSGVIVGTRLDQLLDLKRRVELAIEAERRSLTPRPACRVSSETVPVPRQGSSPTPPVDLVRVHVRDVRVDVIRDWANANGYAMTDRGRIPHLVLEEFAGAHR